MIQIVLEHHTNDCIYVRKICIVIMRSFQIIRLTYNWNNNSEYRPKISRTAVQSLLEGTDTTHKATRLLCGSSTKNGPSS